MSLCSYYVNKSITAAIASNKHSKASDKMGNKNVNSTRSAILDAAISLYQSQGISSTSVSAIIAKSGMGRTTFYRHFSNQDDVLAQILTFAFDGLMADFGQVFQRYDSLEMQIEEDMVWFLAQFSCRPALSLLFSDIKWQHYQQASQSLGSFRQAAMACATPTYERASEENRLRAGITLEQYIDWATFVVISIQLVKLPNLQNQIQSRKMLRNFLIPSLITVD